MNFAEDNKNIFKGILEVALDRDLDDLDLDANLYEHLELDSVGAVAMVVEVQRSYNVRLHEEQLPTLLTSRQVLEEIERRQEAVGAPLVES